MLATLRPVFAAMTLGLAGAGFLAPAPLSAQSVVQLRDYECVVLLQERRGGIGTNASLDPAQRAQIVNNLTIISAYYAGIVSRHPHDQVVDNLALARQQIASATPEHRDLLATLCTDRYLVTLEALSTHSAQAAPQS